MSSPIEPNPEFERFRSGMQRLVNLPKADVERIKNTVKPSKIDKRHKRSDTTKPTSR